MLLNSTAGWIHLSIGKPERWLRWTIFEFAVTVLLFFLALRWGPKGIAVAWSASFWILTIPAFWYAGRPIGFGVSSLIAAVWRYTAASLLAGLTTAAIIRSTPLWGAPPDAKVALQAIVIISGLFLALYLGTVTMLHWGLAPLRQLGSLLRELAPGRTAAGPITELVSERGSA